MLKALTYEEQWPKTIFVCTTCGGTEASCKAIGCQNPQLDRVEVRPTRLSRAEVKEAANIIAFMSTDRDAVLGGLEVAQVFGLSRDEGGQGE